MKKQKRDLNSRITQRFIDALEKGCAPWIRPWKFSSSAGGFPVNAATERRYHGVNVAILWSSAIAHGFDRDRWLTYRQAQNAGGQVRLNEKGTTVIFYRTIENPSAKAGETDDDPKTFRIAKAFTLFNVEQIKSLPKAMMGEAIAQSPPGNDFPEADDLISRSGAKIRHGGNSASYIPESDVIQIPAFQDFDSPEHYYSTLLHEMTHWSGHKKRLNRPGIADSQPFKSTGYAYEELIAEIGSAFLCAEFGIKGDLRHESYVQDWIKMLTDRPRAIFRASAEAQTAFEYLVSIGAEQKKAA